MTVFIPSTLYNSAIKYPTHCKQCAGNVITNTSSLLKKFNHHIYTKTINYFNCTNKLVICHVGCTQTSAHDSAHCIGIPTICVLLCCYVVYFDVYITGNHFDDDEFITVEVLNQYFDTIIIKLRIDTV